MDRYVLILSSADDIHAVAVAAEVMSTRKAHALILDTARYPEHWQLTVSMQTGRPPRWTLRAEGQVVDECHITGVWWRRPNPHKIPKIVKDRKVRGFCSAESHAAFTGWIHSLGERVINPRTAEVAAERKTYQLLKASEVGLKIPNTAITNDPDAAHRFVKDQSNGAIFKVLTAPSWTFADTRLFKTKHKRHLKALRFAPVIFQEFIEADCDIRVTIVDDAIFTVSVRSEYSQARIDWRQDLSAAIEPHVLPKPVANGLRKLMRALGLRFGAIDMRLTPKGDYVFLEINPSGQFLFCEIHGGQPITAALAAALLRRVASSPKGS